MNQLQSYAGKGFYATTPQTDDEERQQMASYTDEDRDTIEITKADSNRWIGWLWANGYLSEDAENWSRAIAVPDSAMSPQLIKGSAAIGIMLDPSEFNNTTGVVAITLLSAPNTYIFGRIDSVSKKQVVISRDNEAFHGLTFARRDIRFMYRVVFSIFAPVL